jgi:hypothetical protein
MAHVDVLRLAEAFVAGESDYTAARLAGCHHNTARTWRHFLERSGFLRVVPVRRDISGREYDALEIGAHRADKDRAKRPGTNRRMQSELERATAHQTRGADLELIG